MPSTQSALDHVANQAHSMWPEEAVYFKTDRWRGNTTFYVETRNAGHTYNYFIFLSEEEVALFLATLKLQYGTQIVRPKTS